MVFKVGSERSLAYRALVFVFALLAAFVAYALTRSAPDAPAELAAQDALARLSPRPARPDVVVVALDDASVKQYGPVKSWPRGLLAQGVRRIHAGGAKAIVLDLAVDRRQGTPSAGDQALWQALAASKNVVLGMAFDAQRPQTYTPDDIRALRFLERDAIADKLTLGPSVQTFPYDLFEPPVSDFTQNAAGVGVFDRETDGDGVVRDSRLFYVSTIQYPPSTKPLPGRFPQSRLADGAPVALPNLSLVAALRVFQLDKSDVRVVSGDTVTLAGAIQPPVQVPVDGQGRMRISFIRPQTAPPAVSFRDLVTGKAKPDFGQKIVLVGATADGDPATDLRATPWGRQPRVFVTQSALSTFLDRSYVEVADRHPHRLLGALLLLGLAVGLTLMWVSGGRAALVTLLLVAVYLGICWGAFASGHLLLPLLPGLGVILLPFLVSLALWLGPFRPRTVGASPTYVPPPAGAVRD